jgi:hypothetical protein
MLEETTCCRGRMPELSSVERPGHRDGLYQRVSVYQCPDCGRVKALGESCDPGWVNAKARLFLDLRHDAFIRAELAPPPPATAIFKLPEQLVFFR